MVIKTELVVSSIKNAIFESRKSGGTPIERFIKRYTFIDTRFQTSVRETRFISSQASYFFLPFFFYETSGQASHSCFHHYRGEERFWPRSVAFEAREKRSDPTTRVSTLNLFSPPFFFFTGTGTRMKFKRQSVSCFFPFFFFFFV